MQRNFWSVVFKYYTGLKNFWKNFHNQCIWIYVDVCVYMYTHIYTVDPWTTRGLGVQMLQAVENLEYLHVIYTRPWYLWFCMHEFNQLQMV